MTPFPRASCCCFFGLCSALLASARQLYVDQLSTILHGSSDLVLSRSAQALLESVIIMNVSSLLMYDLEKILTDDAQKRSLRLLMASAPGVSFTAVAEHSDFFRDRVKPFCEEFFPSGPCFAAYNLEMEFWSTEAVKPASSYGYCEYYLLPQGLPCTTNGAFEYWVATLRKMKDHAPVGVHISASVGEPSQVTDMDISTLYSDIVNNTDAIYVRSSAVDATQAFYRTEERLSNFRATAYHLQKRDYSISVVFSNGANFMDPGLALTNFSQVENDFISIYTVNDSADEGWRLVQNSYCWPLGFVLGQADDHLGQHGCKVACDNTPTCNRATYDTTNGHCYMNSLPAVPHRCDDNTDGWTYWKTPFSPLPSAPFTYFAYTLLWDHFASEGIHVEDQHLQGFKRSANVSKGHGGSAQSPVDSFADQSRSSLKTAVTTTPTVTSVATTFSTARSTSAATINGASSTVTFAGSVVVEAAGTTAGQMESGARHVLAEKFSCRKEAVRVTAEGTPLPRRLRRLTSNVYMRHTWMVRFSVKLSEEQLPTAQRAATAIRRDVDGGGDSNSGFSALLWNQLVAEGVEEEALAVGFRVSGFSAAVEEADNAAGGVDGLDDGAATPFFVRVFGPLIGLSVVVGVLLACCLHRLRRSRTPELACSPDDFIGDISKARAHARSERCMHDQCQVESRWSVRTDSGGSSLQAEACDTTRGTPPTPLEAGAICELRQGSSTGAVVSNGRRILVEDKQCSLVQV